MALDGLMLHQISMQLQSLLPAKINKIQQLSDTELLFTLRSYNQNRRLMISAHSVYNRINITQRTYTTLEAPTGFGMVLRKHIDGGLIQSIEQIGLDRILDMKIQVRNELGDIHTLDLYIELMGKYANVILVNEEDIIIDALKRIPPYENSKRLILPQARFQLPSPHLDKVDPFTHPDVSMQIPFTKQFHGFSPLFAMEMTWRMNHGECFDDVMNKVSNSTSLFISEVDHRTYSHVLPLLHLEAPVIEYELMKGIDMLYLEAEEKVRIKQQSGDLFRVVNHHLHKNESKLPKLKATLDEAFDCDKFREYGDLLFAYMHTIDRQMTKITLPSFEQEDDVTIILDPKLDVKGNANKYYQKYHKGKRAQSIVKEQIEQTEKELEYFETLQMQLEQATIEDANEIRMELSKNGYMKAMQSRIRRRKKQELPHFETYTFDDAIIYAGKNNLQNEYVTWKLAHKDDLWFHTKDNHGAHVILRCDEPNEELIRAAAMIAAWYSSARESSSVAVNYCQVRELKKVPGSKASFVTMKTYKTIYIDPDKQHMQKLMEEHRSQKKQ